MSFFGSYMPPPPPAPQELQKRLGREKASTVWKIWRKLVYDCFKKAYRSEPRVGVVELAKIVKARVEAQRRTAAEGIENVDAVKMFIALLAALDEIQYFTRTSVYELPEIYPWKYQNHVTWEKGGQPLSIADTDLDAAFALMEQPYSAEVHGPFIDDEEEEEEEEEVLVDAGTHAALRAAGASAAGVVRPAKRVKDKEEVSDDTNESCQLKSCAACKKPL